MAAIKMDLNKTSAERVFVAVQGLRVEKPVANSISAETKSTILLTIRLGDPRSDLKLLSPSEFRSVQNWLVARGLTVGDLLGGDRQGAVDAMVADGVGTNLIPSMLERIPVLDQAIAHWDTMGIWVVGETDEIYPDRLRHRLGGAGFPLIFGAGPPESLNQGGLYIVGSRNSSDDGLAFSRTLARRCSEEGITVISSDMRGVDREAMGATNGHIVCVLSDSLEKAVMAKRHRDALTQGTLTIVTPFSPGTRFRVANAIRVNRYQYCLADFAVIVETRRTGGVWLGAEENRKANWVPAFVRADDHVPRGNEALLNLGYMSLSEKEVSECANIGEYLISRLTASPVTVPSNGSENDIVPTLFNFFCEQLASFADPATRTSEEIQQYLDIEPVQAATWIARAVEGGILEEAENTGTYRIRH